MELPKIEKPNFTHRKGLAALGATIAAIGMSGCGFWDSHKEPIIIPADAKEQVDGGGDRAFVMEDSEVNRIIFDCGKTAINQKGDVVNDSPEFIELGNGKMLGVCQDVSSDWPVHRLEK